MCSPFAIFVLTLSLSLASQKQEGYPESIAPAPSGDYGAPAAAQPNSEYGVPN